MTCNNPVAAVDCGSSDAVVAALTCCTEPTDPPPSDTIEVVVTHRKTDAIAFLTQTPTSLVGPLFQQAKGAIISFASTPAGPSDPTGPDNNGGTVPGVISGGYYPPVLSEH